MNKSSIHFRTRGGPNHGWGNVHRLADFADRCRDFGHDTIRFFAEGPDAIGGYLEARGFTTIAMAENISLEEEDKILSSHPRAGVLISEMLDCTLTLQSLLRNYTEKLVIFDDLLDHRYDADLVVCAQALPAFGNIEVSTLRTNFLTGYEYFMFSSAYDSYGKRKRSYSDTIESMLVAFGGGRYDAAYIKTARAIAGMSTSMETTFVLGFAVDDDLKNELAKILPQANFLGGTDNMADLLANTDLAILSAGYLKLEAAITGTPAVLVATQWHQIPLAEEFVKHTSAPYVGYMGIVSSDDISHAITNLAAPNARQEIAQRAANIVDTQGFERVYSAIFGNMN
jgi:UDP-2,4-diacetamido-2,4,6-trideoxy-beta-L-altropyranose hydrolase